MKAFLVLAVIMAFIASSLADLDSDWEDFKKNYGRNYTSPEEEAFRKELFRKTLEKVTEHNKKYERREVTWQMGINNFADWTDEEIRSHLMPEFPAVYTNEADSVWQKFKNNFNRIYNTAEEESFRRNIFYKNLAKISSHNGKYENGKVTFKMGVNNFTDFAKEELQAHSGLIKPLSTNVCCNSLDVEWENFKIKFNRNYGSPEEEAFRKGIFLKHWEVIVEHNKKAERGEVSWTSGINQFADLTREEVDVMHAPKYSTIDFESSWADFKMKFERHYPDTIEDAFRKGIFLYNWEAIVNHNRKYQKGEVTYKMGVNNFTDWSAQEFSSHLMYPITLENIDLVNNCKV